MPIDGEADLIASVQVAIDRITVPPTIDMSDGFRGPYCQGYRHAIADMLRGPMPLTYPHLLQFKIEQTDRRKKVLDAAAALHLTVTHADDGSFAVEIPSPQAAYQLGMRAGA